MAEVGPEVQEKLFRGLGLENVLAAEESTDGRFGSAHVLLGGLGC